MTEEVKVTKGKKIEAAEEKKLDPAKMGLLLAGAPPEGEVEAQGMYYCYTQCPWCGNVGRSVCSSDVYVLYRCGWCGRPFRA